MKKFKWRASMPNTESENSDYARSSGVFEMPDDATDSEIASTAQKLALANVTISHFAVSQRPEQIDWSMDLEIIHDMDDEIETGECRLIGETKGDGKYCHIVGISWNPPRETINFATALGELKGERSSIFIRNKFV